MIRKARIELEASGNHTIHVYKLALAVWTAQRNGGLTLKYSICTNAIIHRYTTRNYILCCEQAIHNLTSFSRVILYKTGLFRSSLHYFNLFVFSFT